jgi:dTDP-4-amino-4,6-dideoxygalactose transaminase
MNVPFLDLKAQYASIKTEVNATIQDVLDSCAFAGGPFVEKFEEEWATYCGVKHAVGVGNGTDALWLAMLALGIGPGDEVITVPNTFIATAEAISLTGAKPVFVDVDEKYYTMNPELLESAITPRTKAAIPVHLFGQMADMDPIMDIARRRGLYVIEDACQAHGAAYKGRKAGSMGDASAFSFYPGKNLGAYGEAGAVTTNNDEIATKIRMLRDHGQSKKYYHDVIGWNARMDGIQGAVLSVKLKHLDDWNGKRRNVAAKYNELLGRIEGLVCPKERPQCWHVYHVYAMRVGARGGLLEYLTANGVSTGIHYPMPVHRSLAYSDSRVQRRLDMTERIAGELVSLPMYPEMADNLEMVSDVCRKTGACLGGKGMKK